MNILLISHWLTVLVSVTLGLLVFATNSRRLVNQAFLMLSMVLALWLTFLGLGFLSRDPGFVTGMVRWSSSTAAFVPALFNLLRIAMSHGANTWREAAQRSWKWLLAALLMFAICHSPWFALGIRTSDVPSPSLIPEPIYGWGIHPFGVYLFTSLALLVRGFFRDMKRCEGISRLELQFTMLGCALGIFFGVCMAVIIPVISGSSQTAQLLPVSVIALDGITAYGIATRRIMDVANVLRRMTAYALLVSYLVVLYAVTWWVTTHALRAIGMNSDFTAHLLAALVAALAMAPANGLMQQVATRLFVNLQSINLSETVQRANRILSSIATRTDLLDQFAALVAQSLGTDRVLILLAEDHEFRQRFPHDSRVPPIRLPADNPLPVMLRQSHEPFVAETLSRFRATPLELQAGAVMKDLQAAIAIGIRRESGLVSLLLLGPRLSGRIYGSEEQRSLEILSNQLAVGLENTELYTRIQDGAIYNDILLDNLVSGVIAAGSDRRVTVYNREAQRIIRRPSHEVLHQPIDLLPAQLRDSLQAAFESGRGVRDAETVLRIHEHDDLHIRMGTSLFHSHTGKVLGALLVFSDLTAIKKLENQVRRTDRLASIGTLSAGMAHEIKNPLVTLKTFTQLLPERYEDQDFRETFSSLVGNEVKRIDSIVNQLLRFARPAKPSLQPTHLHEVIDHTLRLVQQQLKQKGINLRKEYGPNDLIQGDSDLLVQALLNFFMNAIDAMESSGELAVLTSLYEQDTGQSTFLGVPSTETFVRLTIRDTGKGIRPEDIPHVFDPFFTTKSSGTGLGLSVSHGIIHEHQGVIDVESTVGAGTSIHVVFPLLRKEAAV